MAQTGLLSSGTSQTIDSLSYSYVPYSNKLSGVTDGITNTLSESLGDFQDVHAGDGDYAYDANGNLTQDLNKNISSIAYNYLNLPKVITVANKGVIRYYYDAAGNMLQKITTDNVSNTNKVTTYIGSEVFENSYTTGGTQGVDTLQFFGTSEGRGRIASSGFVYDYFLKDHLGNTRMVITDDYNVASPILEATSYYPFGLQMKGIDLDQISTSLHNKKRYNGIECDEDLSINMDEAFYRFHDPQIGRFLQIDPKVESAEAWSPYSAMLDNPILHADPLGDSVIISQTITNDKEMNTAFNAFAHTKQGKKFLANYAYKGQVIDGITFDKQGKYDKQGLDLNYTTKDADVPGEGGVTDASVNGGRGDIYVRLDPISFDKANTVDKAIGRIFEKVNDIFHESFIHADLFTKDFLDNGKFDYSNISQEAKNFSSKMGTGQDNYQHYQVLLNYMHYKEKSPSLWPVQSFLGEKSLNDALHVYPSDQKLINNMWDYHGGVQLDDNGKVIQVQP